MASERISVHSLPDLKNTSDDALPTYLNSLKFTQSHTLSDARLAIGYASVLVCGACFYWDYTYGFEPTKSYTAIAVGIYFILNTFLTFWLFYIYEAAKGRSGQPKEERTLRKPFREWFDLKGHFIVQPFQEMLASNISVIGAVDQKRVVKNEKKVEQEGQADLSMDDKWAALLKESSGDVETSGQRRQLEERREARRFERVAIRIDE
ncbi:signal peptidase complex [Botrytis cinerea]